MNMVIVRCALSARYEVLNAPPQKKDPGVAPVSLLPSGVVRPTPKPKVFFDLTLPVANGAPANLPVHKLSIHWAGKRFLLPA
ncbi:MAG: hypothetical protein RL152_760 [Bacteroidota bacterium]